MIVKGAPTLTHLVHADDIILFTKPIDQYQEIMDILHKFQSLTRQ